MSGGGRTSGFFPKIGGSGGGGVNQSGRGGGGRSDQKIRGSGAGELEVELASERARGEMVPCGSATRANGTQGGGSPIFSGMRILLVGFAPRCRRELERRITERGGLVLSSADYELYTHICVEGETQNSEKRIITKEWIKLCCNLNMRLEASNVLCEFDEKKLHAMSEKMRSLQNISSARRILYLKTETCCFTSSLYARRTSPKRSAWLSILRN